LLTSEHINNVYHECKSELDAAISKFRIVAHESAEDKEIGNFDALKNKAKTLSKN